MSVLFFGIDKSGNKSAKGSLFFRPGYCRRSCCHRMVAHEPYGAAMGYALLHRDGQQRADREQ